MKKNYLLLVCFWGVFYQGLSQENLNEYFSLAYSTYPNIPQGTLEAMSYGATRMGNIIPDEGTHHHHGPDRYGLFGLIADGEGYFDNTLAEVMQYAPVDLSREAFIHNEKAQIMAVAARVSHLCTALNTSDLSEFESVLKEFCEIPGNSTDNLYAQELYVYEVYYHLTHGIETPILFRKPVMLTPENWFDTNNFEILSAPNVYISNQGISNGKQLYNPNGSNNPQPMSADYPPALWSASNNYSSRNGVTISAVTIHTTQGSYSGAISWLKNPAANASAHYVLRSSDGQVTQLILETNKAWHVGSENPYTIGLEHEGFVSQTGWYTTAMYNSSAALVRDICTDRNINPTTCYSGASGSSVNVLSSTIKIKGHQHYPNQTHTDPGINWNWGLFYNLVNNSNTCNAPAGLAAGNITPNSVRLSWGSATGASAYLLRYKTNASSTWTQVTVTSINYHLTGLASNTVYNWQVASICGSNTASFTGGTNFTTMASSSSACAGNITDSGGTGNYGNNENWTFTFAPAGATAVSLTFNSFGLENGYDFMYIYNGPNTSAPLIGSYTGTNSPGTVTGTTGSLTLRFVSDGATVSWGFTGNWSCVVPPTCMDASGLSVSGITSSSANLAWSAIPGAISYTLKYKPVSSTAWQSVTPTSNSYALIGLSAGTQYQWTVATNCSNGVGTPAAGPLFTTLTPCTAPTTLNSSGITSNAATLNWNAIAGAISYTVDIKPLSGTSWTSYLSTANSYTVSGLASSTQYQWKIKTNCMGTSSPSSSVIQSFTTVAPPCNTPGSLSSSSISYTTASLNWGGVSGAVNYTIQWKTSVATVWSSATVSGTTYSLTGLTAGTAYNWRISTNCSSNSSTVSATQSFNTLSCSTPTSTSTANVSTSVATINWATVSGAMGYSLEYKTTAATNWTVINTTATTRQLTGLLASTQYQYRVRTQCSTGIYSGYTAVGTFTTLASCYDAWESNNSSTTATAISAGTSKYGKICATASDVDWFKVTLTSTASITFTLTQLPADYNLEAFTSVYLSGSYNGGSTSETITLTNKPAGTYYFRVYSAAGAFSSTQDYKVTATVTPTLQGGHGTTEIAASMPQVLEMTLFPNPASDILQVKPESTEDIKDLKIRIVTLNGMTVFSQLENFIESEVLISIPIENLAEGMYLLITESADFPVQKVQKFVVKR